MESRDSPRTLEWNWNGGMITLISQMEMLVCGDAFFRTDYLINSVTKGASIAIFLDAELCCTVFSTLISNDLL